MVIKMCTICGRAVRGDSSEQLKHCPYDNIELHFEITEEEAKKFGVTFPEHPGLGIEFLGDVRFNVDGRPSDTLLCGVRKLETFQEEIRREASL